MLPIINIFDCTKPGHSVLSAGLQPEEAGVHIHIGDPDCREYREVSGYGGRHIHIPMPYQLKRQAVAAAGALEKYAHRIADLLLPRLPFGTAGIAHFDNLNWGPLAQRLKATLNMTIVCEYDGSARSGSPIAASMLSVADRIICSSRVARRHLLSLHPGLADRSLVIYHTSSLSRKAAATPGVARSHIRSSWGLGEDEYLVVFNKKSTPQQYDMGPALDIFQNHTPPGARLFVLNETETGRYTSFVRKSDWARINLIGAIPDEDSMDLYSVADRVIIPVLTENNFMEVLSLRQRQIPFVFDHDPGENQWLEEAMQDDPELFSRAAAAEQLCALYREAATICTQGTDQSF